MAPSGGAVLTPKIPLIPECLFRPKSRPGVIFQPPTPLPSAAGSHPHGGSSTGAGPPSIQIFAATPLQGWAELVGRGCLGLPPSGMGWVSVFDQQPKNVSPTCPGAEAMLCPSLPGVPKSLKRWSGRGESNPRHSAWEADVLPLNYTRVAEASGEDIGRGPKEKARRTGPLDFLTEAAAGQSRTSSTVTPRLASMAWTLSAPARWPAPTEMKAVPEPSSIATI